MFLQGLKTSLVAGTTKQHMPAKLQIFSGEDTYESYRAAKKAAAELAQDLNIPMSVVEADELTRDEVLQKLQNIGLFSSGQVLMAKRAMKNSGLVEYIENNLEKALQLPMIIWQDGKLDKRKGVVKKLSQAKVLHDFPLGKSWEVESWLAAKLKNLGLPAGNIKGFTNELILKVGTDKWSLSQEMDKISLFKEAKGEFPDPSVLLGTDVSGDIWKFLDALAGGQKQLAADELQRLFRFGESDQFIIAMLARELSLLNDYLHLLAMGKVAEAGKILKLHPFVLKKLQAKADRFTLEKVKKLLQALLRLDFAIKRGSLDAQVGLTLYLLSW